MNNQIFTLVSGSSLSESDIQQMSEMYAVAFSEAPWNEIWSREDARVEIENAIESSNDFILCKIADIVTGFAIAKILCPEEFPEHQTLVSLGLQQDSYYISELVTHHSYRKKGIASNLISNLFKHACRFDYSEVSLRTKTTNIALLGILKRLKFKEMAEYEVNTGGVTSTRVIFSLPILNERKDACEYDMN